MPSRGGGGHGHGDVGWFRGVLEDVRDLELSRGVTPGRGATACESASVGAGRWDVRPDTGGGCKPVVAVAVVVGPAGDAGSSGTGGGGGRASKSGNLVANAHWVSPAGCAVFSDQRAKEGVCGRRGNRKFGGVGVDFGMLRGKGGGSPRGGLGNERREPDRTNAS